MVILALDKMWYKIGDKNDLNTVYIIIDDKWVSGVEVTPHLIR